MFRVNRFVLVAWLVVLRLAFMAGVRLLSPACFSFKVGGATVVVYHHASDVDVYLPGSPGLLPSFGTGCDDLASE